MISFTWKYSIFQVIQIFIIICYFLQFLFCIGFGYNDVTINILQYELLLIFLWSLFSAIHESGTFNLYVLFLYMLCVFIYSRIFLEIYGLFNWTWADKYNDFIFPINVQFQILILLTFSLLFMHLGCLMGRKYLSYRKINFEYSRYLDKISTFLFLFSVPGTFIKYLIQFKAVLEHGYLAVYDGTIANLKYPIWTTGAISIFEFSYCLFLASKPSKKKFFIISSIFFALRIADVLKGGRSKLFLPIIFLLWYYYSFYSEQQKQKIGKLLLISIVCIILSQVLLEFRRGDVDTGYDSDLFMMFFSQQGVSLLVFAYMIFYKSTFVNTGLPYILYPLSLTSTFEGQSMEFVEQTNSLGHRLTYFLAPDAYLGGEGVGSSFLGEFWDLGLIGFLLMSFLAGYIIRYFEKSVRNTRVIMFLAFILVPNIVYMPRASFFPSLINILIFLFFYSLILYVPKLKIKFI